MAVRSSFAQLLATTAWSGPIRVSFHQFVELQSTFGPSRVSFAQLLSLQSQFGPSRVTTHNVASIQSIHRLLKPEGVLAGGQIFGPVVIGRTSAPVTIPEANPYRPQTPTDFSNSYSESPTESFQREQTATIREQHNITQAGDTTFPWQILTQAQPATGKQYTLGSLGRFFHQDYGLIMARYVQFKDISSAPAFGSPMGFLKTNSQIDWQVTDRLDLSAADMVVGILAPYQEIVDEGFGWVIVYGTAISSIPSMGEGLRAHGDPVSWSGTGLVSKNGAGKIIGRIQGSQPAGGIPPGGLFINLESWSKAQILAMVDGSFQEIADQIDAINAAIEALGNPVNYQPQINAINVAINSLLRRMTTEEGRRADTDRQLSAEIANLNAVDRTTFTAAIQDLTNQINSVNSSLTIQVTQALTKAQQALDKANSIPIVDVDFINAQLAQLAAREDARFPIVDGAVPPNLVYLDDGTLVWE